MKISSAEYVGSAVDMQGFPNSGLPEVGFAGRSNVGKSSLINCLVGMKRLSHTSSTPGRTRCLNFFLINSSFYFVDFPGYGYAKVSKKVRSSFRALIELYLSYRPQLRGVLVILDGRHAAMDSDLMLKDWLMQKGLPYQIVLTKMDKVPRREWAEVQGRAASSLGCEKGSIILFSAVSGDGKKQIWQAIGDMLRDHQSRRKSARPDAVNKLSRLRQGRRNP